MTYPLSNLPVVNRIYKKISIRQLSLEKQQAYWISPWDGLHNPVTYLETGKAGKFLMDSVNIVETVNKYIDKDASILEIGCGPGRNLNALFNAGFTSLEGIEISPKMIEVLRQSYPEMAQKVGVYNLSAEDALPTFPNNSFDLVFAIAVLTYIHPKSSWLFSEIARVTNTYIITVEPETKVNFLKFPRNYKKVFSRLRMTQIFESASDTKMVTRVFLKNTE